MGPVFSGLSSPCLLDSLPYRSGVTIGDLVPVHLVVGKKLFPTQLTGPNYWDGFTVPDGSSRSRIKYSLLITLENHDSQHCDRIFCDSYSLPRSGLLCADAHRSLTVDNAGGQSDISEAFSIDYFSSIFGADSFLLEKEVSYWIDYKMVDFICSIGGNRVGVSVTRAMGFPSADDFNEEQALRLLHKKLYGLIVARNAVEKRQAFFRSILHIWCQDDRVAKLVREAYSSFDIADYGLDIQGTVVLLLTVCPDPQLYSNFLSPDPDDVD